MPVRRGARRSAVGRLRLTAALVCVLAVSWLGPGGSPAAAAPPTPSFGPAIDPYADYVPQTTCDPVAKPGVADFRQLVLAAYPQTSDLGIVRACDIGGTSEHKEGRAWDWGVSASTQSAVANDLLGWLLATDKYGNRQALLRRLGIMYIIWNSRIFGAYAADQGWRPYPCGGSTGRDCHTTHVHFSFSWDGALRQTSWWTGVPTVGGGGDWHSLGGQIVGGPDLAAHSPGGLDVVARGTNNYLYHRSRAGSTWAGWENLGGVLTSDPAAVSWGDGRLDVFGRGTDNALWHRYYDRSSGWSPWLYLGGVLVGGPDAASQGRGRLDVVVQGTDRMLYRRSYDQASGWGPWQPLGGIVTADPAVTSWSPGRLDVFGRGTDNALWHRFMAGGVWYGWERLGGILASGVDATSGDAGRLDVVITGTDWHVYRRSYTAGRGWSPFERLTGAVSSTPAVVSPYPGAVLVAARLATGELGWRSLPGRVGSGSLSANALPGD
ncbi:MAG: hypothetical protein ACR2JO_08640 [Mycobacteriales bacterium]